MNIRDTFVLSPFRWHGKYFKQPPKWGITNIEPGAGFFSSSFFFFFFFFILALRFMTSYLWHGVSEQCLMILFFCSLFFVFFSSLLLLLLRNGLWIRYKEGGSGKYRIMKFLWHTLHGSRGCGEYATSLSFYLSVLLVNQAHDNDYNIFELWSCHCFRVPLMQNNKYSHGLMVGIRRSSNVYFCYFRVGFYHFAWRLLSSIIWIGNKKNNIL